MSDNKPQTEQHGCIVCGKVYFMEVTYGTTGGPEKCLVLTPGGHCIPDPQRPLVACDHHSASQIEDALTNRYPGATQEDEEEE